MSFIRRDQGEARAAESVSAKGGGTAHYTLVQCFNWGSYAAVWVYIVMILKSYGMSYSAAGIVTSCASILAITLQQVLSGAVDRSRRFTSSAAALLQIGAAILLAVFLLIDRRAGMVTAGICFCAVGVCITGIQPFLSAVAMEQVRAGRALHFGFARGCGSVAYAVMSAVSGRIFGLFGKEGLLIAFIALYSVEFIVTASFSRRRTEEPVEERRGTTVNGFRLLREHPRFALFLVSSALLYSSYMLAATYMDAIVTRAGGKAASLGIVIAIGAAVEMPAMIAAPSLMRRFSYRKILTFAGLIFVVRMIALFFAPNMPLLCGAWALQALSYGFFTPVSVYFVNEVIDPANQTKAQAMNFGSTTVGGVIGNLIGGRLVDSIGIGNTLLAAGCISLAGLILLISIFSALPRSGS